MENKKAEHAGGIMMPMLKCLLASYVLTAVLLLALAGAMWKFGLGEAPVCGAVIVIYVIANLAGGFLAGKSLETRRILWGFLSGILYFVILTGMSLAVNGDAQALGDSFFTTLVLCAGGGMIGAFLS